MTDKIKLTFLGTSDAVPSALRNHPAILLTYSGENILFDCGEGTQRQFRKAGLNPCKLTKILITHWHADHILGIPGLLKTLEMSSYNKTLCIYGPKGIKNSLSSLLNAVGFGWSYGLEIIEVKGKFFENKEFYLEAEQMTHGVSCNAYSFVKKGQIRIDKDKLNKLKIPIGAHLKSLKEGKNMSYLGKNYLMKKLTYKDKDRKISFVLDTSLNNKIIPFVKNSDILVCESTFTSELESKAKEHHHLTASQTATIAKKSKTGKLFLIHISQRFSDDLKKILEESKKIFKESYLPKDLDVVAL